MKIGNVKIENRLLLAPMAGVTDAPFRAICAEFGYGLAYTEMISAKALMYKDKKTFSFLVKSEEEPEPAVQIFGSDIEAIKFATELLNKTNTPIIDINMGCPAPKVVKNGEGSALMKDPDKAAKVIKAAVEVSEKPVTVKIRAGWNKDNINAVEFALMAQECGVAAVAVHPRTRDMYYSGKADWEIIKKVKEKLDIPVIGGGDIFFADDAIRMMETTNCDAVMVARGVMGNPWIFRDFKALENNTTVEKVSIDDKKAMIKQHMKLLVKYKGEHRAILEIRKHASWYSKGERNASKFKNIVFTCKSFEELVKALEVLSI
ncbi:MAG: tRNA dihydrouridine synthase DusB [Clostridiales bacterium]|nr:tRNA dihydrouridine synthase DusB [Clostridiales bacterium]